MYAVRKTKTVAQLMCYYFTQISPFWLVGYIYSLVVPIGHSKAYRAVRTCQIIVCAVNKFNFPLNTIYQKHISPQKKITS